MGQNIAKPTSATLWDETCNCLNTFPNTTKKSLKDDYWRGRYFHDAGETNKAVEYYKKSEDWRAYYWLYKINGEFLDLILAFDYYCNDSDDSDDSDDSVVQYYDMHNNPVIFPYEEFAKNKKALMENLDIIYNYLSITEIHTLMNLLVDTEVQELKKRVSDLEACNKEA